MPAPQFGSEAMRSRGEVRLGPVLDIEVVADVVAVRSDHRSLPAKDRANGAWHDSVPFRSPPPKKLPHLVIATGSS